ncbi:MAG: UbiA family prenyltransferase [Candidatus Woesearchaeota archaeon]|jgi:4-hydroxybenzoate polyprenyltransferase
MSVGVVLSLIRAKQWYKNLLVFLPLIFSSNLFSINLLLLTSMGFLAFCAASSINYILNDIIDKKKDCMHPEKKTRPIASGKISIVGALFVLGLLIFILILILLNLPLIFSLLILTFVVITQIYSLVFKNILFADALFISINFVLRAIAGAFVVSLGFKPYVVASPWLILSSFFLSLLLVVSKREADIRLLGSAAVKHKKVLGEYTLEMTGALMIILTSVLLIVYSIYSVFSYHFALLLSLPFAIFCLFRWFYLVKSNSIISRHLELAYLDMPIIISGILWFCSVCIGIYLL